MADFKRYILSLTGAHIVQSTETPKITLKSQSSTIDEGSSITLLCAASAIFKPFVGWSKGSKILKENFSSCNYTILAATKNDTGTYNCTAVYTVPGLRAPNDNYQVNVTVRCKLL